MTSWADFRNALKAAVVAARPQPRVVPSAVAWSDEQRPTAKTLVILDIVSSVAMHDREDEALAAPPPGTTWVLSTLHQVSFQVRVEATDAGVARDALGVAEAIRTGLQRPSVNDTLRAAGAALEWPLTGAVVRVPTIADGRVVSAWAFDVFARAVLDFAPDETGYTVETVGFEGEGTTPTDGTEQGDAFSAEFVVDRPA